MHWYPFEFFSSNLSHYPVPSLDPLKFPCTCWADQSGWLAYFACDSMPIQLKTLFFQIVWKVQSFLGLLHHHTLSKTILYFLLPAKGVIMAPKQWHFFLYCHEGLFIGWYQRLYFLGKVIWCGCQEPGVPWHQWRLEIVFFFLHPNQEYEYACTYLDIQHTNGQIPSITIGNNQFRSWTIFNQWEQIFFISSGNKVLYT